MNLRRLQGITRRCIGRMFQLAKVSISILSVTAAVALAFVRYYYSETHAVWNCELPISSFSERRSHLTMAFYNPDVHISFATPIKKSDVRAVRIWKTPGSVLSLSRSEGGLSKYPGWWKFVNIHARWWGLAMAGILGAIVLQSTSLLRYLKKGNSRGTCGECKYSLTGNVSGICPECGTPIPKPRDMASPTAS